MQCGRMSGAVDFVHVKSTSTRGYAGVTKLSKAKLSQCVHEGISDALQILAFSIHTLLDRKQREGRYRAG